MNNDNIKTSNIFELFGLIVNKFGFVGFTTLLVGYFIHSRATEEQNGVIIDTFIDIITLNGTYYHYILLGVFAIYILIRYYYFNNRNSLIVKDNEELNKRIQRLHLELESYKKDAKAVELRKQLKLVQGGKNNSNQDFLELRNIREYLDNQSDSTSSNNEKT